MMRLKKVLVVGSCLLLLAANVAEAQQLKVEITVVAEGDADWDWQQTRSAYVPGSQPLAITTLSQTKKVGAHGYHDVFITYSEDGGQTWGNTATVPSLKRTLKSDGYEVSPGDLCPQWHAKTGKVLITGKTFNFADGKKENYLREQVSYAVLDAKTRLCGPLRTIDMPVRDHQGKSIIAPNAGCHQRVDLPNGEILLPIRYQQSAKRRNYTSIVARCRFDGETLSYVEHGTEHAIPTGRGLYEPSVGQFGNEFFLTLRADDGAYVCKSSDGIHYTAHKPWTFDDGQLLGSYNTQQHWLTVGGKLYLVYTRRGANNDHIMRHRAPLFIARVDPEKLHVVRATEQILIPENHAQLGNSGVCKISDAESWVTVAETGISRGKRAGENNKVLLAKVTVK